MGQVSVTINTRSYKLSCQDGEEDRLAELATYVKSKVDTLVEQIGHAGDERLMLMAAILIADELWDSRATVQSAGAKPDEGGALLGAAGNDSGDPAPVQRLRKVSARLAKTLDEAPTSSTDEGGPRTQKGVHHLRTG